MRHEGALQPIEPTSHKESALVFSFIADYEAKETIAAVRKKNNRRDALPSTQELSESSRSHGSKQAKPCNHLHSKKELKTIPEIFSILSMLALKLSSGISLAIASFGRIYA